jgi:hypothetical protein
VQEGEFNGGCQAHMVEFVVVVATGGCRMLVRLAACSGSWQLACGVGLHQKTALVATTMWDDQACSGFRRVAQLCWSYSSVVHHEDGASDILGSLLW